MSSFYHPQRTRNLYDPASTKPFRISRSKIDLFLECPRCFYLDRRRGVARPPGYPFSLNAAVDTLLKKEFDVHRAAGTKHPLCETYGIDAVPLAHTDMDAWRDALRRGVTCDLPGTNLCITGAVDDVWVDPDGRLIVVDYKATSKTGEVTIDAPWQDGYKRQIEVYQWLLRRNGHPVSDRAYFVYCNGDADKEVFDGKLEFRVRILEYIGDDGWVENVVRAAYECLRADAAPASAENCDYCRYVNALRDALR